MATVVGSITRAASRRNSDKLNVLTCCTHERWQSGLADTNAAYYMVRTPDVKDWNSTYAPLPKNHVLLNPRRGEKQIPADLDFDLVLSQNKFGQFQLLSPIARKLQLPLVSVEHTLVHPSWSAAQISQMSQMRGDINVFISDFSVEKWGFSKDDSSVRIIHHGIDTNLFSPWKTLYGRKRHLLSVVNDWKNRDWCCGFNLWQSVTEGLPTFVVGDTPGLSSPAKNTQELVERYRESRIFLNTSLVSPIPTALLEAMSCGCAVVSTATAMIPQVVEHGVNGFISNNPIDIAGYCRLLLDDVELCRKMGEAARQTIVERFRLDRFISDWDNVLREASELIWRGGN